MIDIYIIDVYFSFPATLRCNYLVALVALVAFRDLEDVPLAPSPMGSNTWISSLEMLWMTVASASSVVAGGASSAQFPAAAAAAAVQRLEDTSLSLAERAAAAEAEAEEDADAASAERAAEELRVAAASAAATDAAAAEADPALRLEAISAAVAMSSIERMMRAISSRSDVDSVCTGAGAGAGAGTAYASTRSVSAEMEALMTRMAFCSWISWCTIMDGLLFIFLTVVT